MRQRATLVTKEDLRIETFRVGGAGGQHRDKTSAGVRITHPASGAVGEGRDSRSQKQNQAAAFRHMIDTPAFQVWMDLELHPEHVVVEIRRAGEWVRS